MLRLRKQAKLRTKKATTVNCNRLILRFVVWGGGGLGLLGLIYFISSLYTRLIGKLGLHFD
jgi:hypothetical protein